MGVRLRSSCIISRRRLTRSSSSVGSVTSIVFRCIIEISRDTNPVNMSGHLIFGQSRGLDSAGNTQTGGASPYDTRIIMDRAKYGGMLFVLPAEPSKAWVCDRDPPAVLMVKSPLFPDPYSMEPFPASFNALGKV